MSEFEKLNEKSAKRFSARQKVGIKRIALELLKLLVWMVAFCALLHIGFISEVFCVILAEVIMCCAAFNIGCIWRDIRL